MTGDRILIVEDESIIARDITQLLVDAQYTVVGVAHFGKDAIRLATQTQPDLILMDIRLHGELDGIATSHEIRTRQQIPIIFITAFADKDTVERARDSEPFGYLIKPFTAQELYTAIELALYRHRMEQQAKNMERMYYASLVNAQEVERRRISQELHDDVGQALTAVHINLMSIKVALKTDIPSTVHQRIEESIRLIDEVTSRTKDLSRDLWPTLLNDLGLISALRSYSQDYAKRLGIHVDLAAVGFDEGSASKAEQSLYRIAQEALTNVAKHASAQTVDIHLERSDMHLTMEIFDDGKGFDVRATGQYVTSHGGIGLRVMRERCKSLGGLFEIKSAAREGHQGDGSASVS